VPAVQAERNGIHGAHDARPEPHGELIEQAVHLHRAGLCELAFGLNLPLQPQIDALGRKHPGADDQSSK
jgi:hypothetical protein